MFVWKKYIKKSSIFDGGTLYEVLWIFWIIPVFIKITKINPIIKN